MKTNVLVFGQLTDIFGGPAVEVEGATDTNSLIAQLKNAYPALNTINFMVAVDKKMITANTTLHADSVIALMPPFSGG